MTEPMCTQEDGEILSQTKSRAYVYFPSVIEQNPLQYIRSSHGKWILFCAKGEAQDAMWLNVIEFTKRTASPVVTGKDKVPMLLFARASTALPNAYGSDSSQGVIMLYCANCLSHADIMQVGKLLVKFTGYTSAFGKIFYKSEINNKSQQAEFFQRRPQATYFLEVEPSIRKGQTQQLGSSSSPSSSSSTQEMQISDSFEVPFVHKEIAKKFGCAWNASANAFVALTDKAWENMIRFFPQKVTQEGTLSLEERQSRENIKVFSLNLWFVDLFTEKRMQLTALNIRAHNPDVICLQEATPTNLEFLHPLLLSLGYHTQSKPKTHSSKALSEMLYFKTTSFKVSFFAQIPLMPLSTNKRELHFAHVRSLKTVPQHDLMFATAHFETGHKHSELRARQWNCVQSFLENKSLPWVFAGDTNMSYRQTQVVPKPFACDAWVEAGSSEHTRGTWDPERNANIQMSNDIRKCVGKCRFDRCLFRCDSFKVKQFSLACTKPEAGNNLFASDHFAIVANLHVTC